MKTNLVIRSITDVADPVWALPEGAPHGTIRRFHRTTSRFAAAFLAALSVLAGVISAHAQYSFTNYAGIPGRSGTNDGFANAPWFSGPNAVAADANGTVYIADSGNHAIRKVTAVGVVTTFAGTLGVPGTADGTGDAARFSAPQSVAVDASGNVYVADSGNNTIRKITPGGDVSTLAGTPGVSGTANGTGGAARFSSPRGIAVDASGNVYVADCGNNTIRKITSGGNVSTLAGAPGVSGTANGTGGAARFSAPQSVAVDASGNVYVADCGNHTIRKITSSGDVSTLAGAPGASGAANGTAPAARFSGPSGVAVDTDNNIYVADTGNGAIRKITSTGTVSTLAGTPGTSGTANGIGSIARFNAPHGVAVNATGNVYVADTMNHTIRIVTPAGRVSTLAGHGGARFNFDQANWWYVYRNVGGVAVAPFWDGNVYVADTGNHTIRKITPEGVVTTFAGTPGNAGLADGFGGEARFDTPVGIAVDSTGNVFVADFGNAAIRKITPGGYVSTLAVWGALWGPWGVAVDGSNNVYVTDYFANAIFVVSNGVVSTLAGTPGTTGTADGTGSDAQFSGPTAIALDANGNAYVVDLNNNAIRFVTPGGDVTTTLLGPANASGIVIDPLSGLLFGLDYWGNELIVEEDYGGQQVLGGAGVAGWVDGDGTAAQFNQPVGIVADAYYSNGLYILDAGNNRISKGYIPWYSYHSSTLAGFLLSTETLTPAFDPYNTSYSMTVPNDVSSVALGPVPTDPHATVTVVGGTNLAVGPNTVTITVSTPDWHMVYTIGVTRAGSAVDLSALTLSRGGLNPAFIPSVTTYTASVDYSVTSVAVTPTLFDNTSTVRVVGGTNLQVGANTITVTVTAQDGVTTKVYTVTVTRGAPSSDANLSGLTLSSGTLSPAFSSSGTSYTVAVPNSVTSIGVSPTPSNGWATVQVTGASNLAVGANTVTVTVTAQDGVTTKVYSIVVTRLPSSNANLSALALSNGMLSPAFSSSVTSYTAAVPYYISWLAVTPTRYDGTAAVQVSGGSNLAVGANTVTVTVTAQDGVTTKVYTVIVTRAAPSTNANLSDLALSSGTLSPAFSSSGTSYTATVPNSVASVGVIPVLSDTTAFALVGGGSDLAVGENTVTVTVIAQDNVTIKVYTVVVTRAPSSNANLSDLALSTGTLSPAFSPGCTSYSTAVPNSVTSITVTPALSDITATAQVSGGSHLTVGTNPVTVTVTAQDGVTTKVYTVMVTRPPSSCADLFRLLITSGTLSPAFTSSGTAYAASVNKSVLGVAVMPTVTDSTATVQVTGGTNLAIGPNTVTVTVTAEDGVTTKVYTIVVNRTLDDPETNIALNTSGSGYPTPLESDSGWGGGSYPWDLVDGQRIYTAWNHGLAFIGNGHGGTSGPRQATIEFGANQTFHKVIISHNGWAHVPANPSLDYWNGTAWVSISFQRSIGYYVPSGITGVPCDEYTFSDVVGSKVRFSFDNRENSVLGSQLVHGWLHNIEVYGGVAAPTPTVVAYSAVTSGSGGHVVLSTTVNANGVATSIGFDGATGPNLAGWFCPCPMANIGSGTTPVIVSAVVNNLTAGTTYFFRVNAFTSTDASSSAFFSVTIPQSPAPVITSTLSVTGTTGYAFSYQIDASNSPTGYGASGLPPGLALNAAAGLLSGTPSTSGTFLVPLAATNATGSGFASLTLSVLPSPAALFTTATSGGQVTITGYSGTPSEISIPSTIDGLPVTAIGNSAFYGCTGLTSVTIPSSVTAIGSSAFYGCTGLVSVSIPSSVTTIGDSAFCGCTQLPSVTIPASVTAIGDSSFRGCTGLTSLTIPSSVTSIGGNAFSGCTNVTSVIIPPSVTIIGGGAFSDCTRMTSVTIPDSVTTIGGNVFGGCRELNTIVLEGTSSSLTTVDGVLFDSARTSLLQCPARRSGSYSIPPTVTTIGNRAFEGCTGLTSVEIPPTIVSIGNRAFQGCTGLRSVSIPTSVTSIGDEAFQECTALISVAIPPSVTSIASSLFRDCAGLLSVSIPDSIASIGDQAFSGCTGLTSVTLPHSVTSIGDRAFYGCSALVSAIFRGCAPPTIGVSEFDNTASEFTIHYFAGASGFTSPQWLGYPALSMTTAQTWAAVFGLSGSDAQPVATPLNDGVPNLVKFALGLPGNAPANPLAMPVTEREQDAPIVHFIFHRATSVVRYVIESSTNLAAGLWTVEAVIEKSADTSTVGNDVDIPSALGTGQKKFYRLRIEQ